MLPFPFALTTVRPDESVNRSRGQSLSHEWSLNHGRSVDALWTIHEPSIDRPHVGRDGPTGMNGVFIGGPWIISSASPGTGLTMDAPWTIQRIFRRFQHVHGSFTESLWWAVRDVRHARRTSVEEPRISHNNSVRLVHGSFLKSPRETSSAVSGLFMDSSTKSAWIVRPPCSPRAAWISFGPPSNSSRQTSTFGPTPLLFT